MVFLGCTSHVRKLLDLSSRFHHAVCDLDMDCLRIKLDVGLITEKWSLKILQQKHPDTQLLKKANASASKVNKSFCLSDCWIKNM